MTLKHIMRVNHSACSVIEDPNSTNPCFCIFNLLSKTAITSIRNEHWICLRHVTYTVSREHGRGRKIYFSFLTIITSRSRTMKKYLMRYFANGWLKTHSKYSVEFLSIFHVREVQISVEQSPRNLRIGSLVTYTTPIFRAECCECFGDMLGAC